MAQEEEDQDQDDEPPQEEDINQGGDEDDQDKEGDQEIQDQRPPHPRVHQAIQRDHPVNSILDDIHKGVTTRSRVAHFCEYYCFVSSIEPYRIDDALRDPDWVVAMQEELINFTRNEVWHLLPRPDQNVVGTKWVFHNKQDEHGVVTRNKDRLVAKGYSQVEGLDFDETYAPVDRLESIRTLLAYATYHSFKLYQMDVKSVFLNGLIKEEVYVEQPPGFEDNEYPTYVYVGGLRLPKVLKNIIWQCFPSMRADIFGIRLWIYKSMVKTKLDWNGRRSWRRMKRSWSYVQKTFGMTAEKGNRLKDEKPN
jgi:hypothetical protein